jgi:hypothetical protein
MLNCNTNVISPKNVGCRYQSTGSSEVPAPFSCKIDCCTLSAFKSIKQEGRLSALLDSSLVIALAASAAVGIS